MQIKIIENFKNRSYVEKLYELLGISIFLHYGFVILFSLLILLKIIFSGEYKKIRKSKSLILVELVMLLAIVMSIRYENYYGLVAIPVLFCIIVGRYYTLVISNDFKNKNLELISFVSIIPFFTSIIEVIITRNRAGYVFFNNPNYLGSVMMMIGIVNLYFTFEKKSKINFVIFILNIMTIIMSGSRSALIALFAGILWILYKYLKRKYFYGIILFLFGYVVGVISGVFPFLRASTVIEYFWLRVDIIKMAIIIFKRTNILFGHGNFFYYKFTNFVYPHTHNAIVELLVSYGLIGTTILTIVFIQYVYRIMQDDKKNILKVALILGVLCHNFTDFTIFWIQTVILFILIFSYREDKKRTLK